MNIGGIKQKLPLINSSSKRTRWAGYVVYAFAILFILSNVFPRAHDPDTEWAKAAGTCQSSVDGKLAAVQQALTEGELATAKDRARDLRNTAEVCLGQSKEYTVSNSTKLSMKKSYEQALQNYMNYADTIQGIDFGSTAKLEEAEKYLETAITDMDRVSGGHGS